MPATKKLLQVKDVLKDYTTGDVVTHVLRGVSFDISEGEFLAIMGPSGSGKSTLMYILGFLDRLTSGTYLYKEKDVTTFSDDQLAHLRNEEIGFVFQSYNLLSKTTVYDNVMLPLVYSDVKGKELDRRVREAVEAVGLTHRIDHYSNQLSGGESQRVAIARALVNQPSVIFADEPTGNLDSKSGTQVMKIIQDLNKAGKTVILVTHEQDTAEHAKRIIHIKDGKLVSDNKVARQRFAKDGELRK